MWHKTKSATRTQSMEKVNDVLCRSNSDNSSVYSDVAMGKLPEKSSTVFKCALKMCSDSDDVTHAGSPFQTRAAETGKVWSPTVHVIL